MAQMNEFVELLGFAPEAPTNKEGAMLVCQQFIPTEKGSFRSPYGARALSGAAIGFGTANQHTTVRGVSAPLWATDGYFYDLGTDDAIYRQARMSAQHSWHLVGTSSSAGTFAVSGGGQWSFEQFGKFVIAARGSNLGGACPLQVASVTVGGAYADLAGAPSSSVLAVTDRFVLAFCEPGEDNVDRWRCCARDDHTNWSLSPATLAATGRLVDTPGPITAAKNFGNDVIAYKQRSMYRGRYVEGAQEVWMWELLPFRSGASNPSSVLNVDTVQFALSNEGLFKYDGAQVTEVMGPDLRPWYERYYGVQNYQTTKLVYDAGVSNLWCYIGPYSEDPSVNVYLVYNTKSGKWGVLHETNWLNPQSLHSRYRTPEGAGSLRASMFRANGTQYVFDDEERDTFTLSPILQYFATAWLGSDDFDAELTRARLRHSLPHYQPTGPSIKLRTYKRDWLGAFAMTGVASATVLPDRQIDVRQMAKYHQLYFDFPQAPNQAPVEVYGYQHDLTKVQAEDGR